MCFCAEASVGVAAALLPVGGYCFAAAWRKNRAYLPLAAAPLLFGLQQLCEARVWDALGHSDPELARVPSLAFLFFALTVWPVWMPLAAAFIEPISRRRWMFFGIVVIGALFGLVYWLPVAVDGHGLSPAVVGHSIRYDFSAAAFVRSVWWWIGPLLYLAITCGSLLASSNRRLQLLGGALVAAAAISYALFSYAFASVWCFFAAILSMYVAFVLHQLPDRDPRDG